MFDQEIQDKLTIFCYLNKLDLVYNSEQKAWTIKKLSDKEAHQ